MPITIHVLEQGYIEAFDAPFRTEDGLSVKVNAIWPVRCYLIRHPAGDILWDTGLPEVPLAADPYALGGMPKSVVNLIEPWLATFGLDCSSIPCVGFSHLHIDHGGNANAFPKATILVSGAEYKHALTESPGGAYFKPGYDRIGQNPARLIDGVTDVFGDGTLTIIPAPGHSPGHQVLQIALPGERPCLLMGDAAYGPDDLTERTAPVWNWDPVQSFATMDNLVNLAAATGARMLFHHDPDSVF